MYGDVVSGDVPGRDRLDCGAFLPVHLWKGKEERNVQTWHTMNMKDGCVKNVGMSSTGQP